MRIAVGQPAAGQQVSGLNQLVHHQAVGGTELAGLLALDLQHLGAAEEGNAVEIGAVGVHGLGDFPAARFQPDQIIFLAVARRGVDEARAGVVGDVIARQHRHIEAIAGSEAGQRVGADHVRQLSGGDRPLQPPALDPGGGEHRLGQGARQHQPVADLGPGFVVQPALQTLHPVDGVGDGGTIADRPVGRDGPGRGGPDHHRGADQGGRAEGRRLPHHRELDPDRRRGVLVVLDLGVGERGALHRAPHHRLGAAVELAAHQELVELADDGGLGAVVHGGVAVVPVAQHAQALELLALHLDPLGGVFATAGAELGLGDLVLAPALGAELLLDLPLDGQAMAVPAGHVVHVLAERELAADHEVLEQLVQRMADVDRAVGVGRPVVQHEQRGAGVLARLAHGGVEVELRPALQDLRLQLRQARAHGEVGVRQEHRVAIVARGGVGRGGGGVVVGHGDGELSRRL